MNEIVKMAVEAGFEFYPDDGNLYAGEIACTTVLKRFACAILERAALECDKKANHFFELAMKSKEGSDSALLARASGAHGCANVVRLLKTQGD